jgi:GH24 family phage-related lysozyme (muramidase)
MDNMFADLIPQGQPANANMFADLIPQPEVPESTFWHSLGENPQQKNFPNVKEEGSMLPVEVTYNPDGTVDSSRINWNQPLTHLAQGIGDLYRQAEVNTSGNVTSENAVPDASPASINAMVALSGMPAATRIGASAIDNTLTPMAKRIAQITDGGLAGETNPNSFWASNSSVSKSPAATPSPIDAQVLKDTSQKAYKFAEDQGGGLNAGFTGDVRTHLEDAKIQPVGQKPLTNSAEAFNNKIDELMPVEGESWTLDDYEKFDKLLTREKVNQMDGFAHTPDSRALSIAQQKIRDRLQSLSESDVTGGKAGFDALTQDAIPVWSAKTKMDDLESIINRANAMDNPSIAMRTGFRNLMLNNGKMASYPAEVQSLIVKAAKQGKVDDLLGVLGSRLNAIGAGAVGGIPGEIAGHIVSSGFRGIRNNLINNRASDVMDALTEPLRPIVEKYQNPISPPVTPPAPPMLALSAPQVTNVTNTYGQIVPVTPASRGIIGQSPSTLAEQTPAANAASNDWAAQSQSEMGSQLGTQRAAGNENANFQPNELTALQRSQQVARMDYEKSMAQKAAQDAAPPVTAASTGGKTIEDIISGNADRNDLGTMASVFMNLGKNQSGNLSTRGATALGLAGATGMAMKQNTPAPKPAMSQPAKYQTMDDLVKSIPELQPPTVPPSFQSEEGFRNKVYTDPTGHKTVGIGFNMDSGIARDVWKQAGIQKDFNDVRSGKQQINQDEAQQLLTKSYGIAQDDIKKLVPNVDSLSPKAQEGLHQLAFQHGYSALKNGLPGVIASANQGNMTAAAGRLLASDYAKRYKDRAMRIARMLAG